MTPFQISKLLEAAANTLSVAESVLDPTPENIKEAKTFFLTKWKERAKDLGREEPQDSSGGCIGAALFAKSLFGGKIDGHYDHVYLRLPSGKHIDLSEDSTDVKKQNEPYRTDNTFLKSRDFKERLQSWEWRVDKWVDLFMGSRRNVKAAVLAGHDYNPHSDYDVDEDPYLDVEEAVTRSLPDMKKLAQDLGVGEPSVHFVTGLGKGHLARYADGTSSAPVIVIDSKFIMELDETKGPLNIEALVFDTLVHELGHAWCDSSGLRGSISVAKEEKAVERFAIKYSSSNSFKEAFKILQALIPTKKQGNVKAAVPALEQMFSDDSGTYKIADVMAYLEHRKIEPQWFDIEELALRNLIPSENEIPEDIPGTPEFIERANKTDLSYPIIVVEYPDGQFIADGVHRLGKARAQGLKKIKGYLMGFRELEEV